MSRAPRKLNATSEAIRLLSELRLEKAPVPVERIAKHVGALVRFCPLDDEISGMVFVKDGSAIIGVNSLHHPNRQRFTIAHEIGHLVLHRQLVELEVHVDKHYKVLMRDVRASEGKSSVEIEANRFAAELLMPRHLLEREDLILEVDNELLVEELALKYRVSRQAMSLRIGSLFPSFA